MLLTLETIQRQLATQGYHLEFQKETEQLYMLLTQGNASFPFFVRLYDHGELLQLIAFMPFAIKQDNEGNVARLLHLINKDLDLPGFGMDETNEIIFYRLMLPIHKLHLEETLLNQMVSIFPNICQTFSGPIMALAQGKETLETIVKALNELKQSVE
ncbi:MAG: YbjN domain-containing protein [Parachlamydiaceae bacterium]|nr:YbjN domain-containing protein [Parachlamydiaceae bacterium]